ncbi:pentapeptide repeat-containing protein [Streptomyces naphthomycinicus]|uniref:pentapeptide repeat-containing protein n=1 Tax=Streptomyces naphthomycinicus TaxID=2872625 RepID=UPI0027E4470E|nr:pentapeptide repeat-containing protein [Streptomyces sp. TML10]
MTRGTPRAGARGGQLRRIAQRRARAGQPAGQRPRAPLGARPPGHRHRAPERHGAAAAPRPEPSAEKAPDIQAALSVLGQRDPAHDGERPIDLRGVRLADVDLRGADLRGVKLTGAVLPHGSLADTDLSGADLRGVSFRGTDLTGADLADAYLYQADLREADLTGADLRGANPAAADLTGAAVEAVRVTDTTDFAGAHRPEGDLPTAGPIPAPRSPSPSAPRNGTAGPAT